MGFFSVCTYVADVMYYTVIIVQEPFPLYPGEELEGAPPAGESTLPHYPPPPTLTFTLPFT